MNMKQLMKEELSRKGCKNVILDGVSLVIFIVIVWGSLFLLDGLQMSSQF